MLGLDPKRDFASRIDLSTKSSFKGWFLYDQVYCLCWQGSTSYCGERKNAAQARYCEWEFPTFYKTAKYRPRIDRVRQYIYIDR